MIGDLIKISPKQLPTLGGKKRKLPLWRRTWFKSAMLLLVMTGLTAYVGIMLWLRPFRERANEFDLTQMNHLEMSTSFICD